MASAERPGLWSFASLKMDPGAQGDYQKTGTVLMAMGWINLVSVALGLLVGLLMLAFMGGTGAFMGAAMWDFFGPIPMMMQGAMMMVMAVFLLVMAALGIAYLYWNSWLYAKWVARDARALQHVMVFAIVGLVLNGVSALSGSLLSVALVVLNILLLVWGQTEQAKAAFRGPPMPSRPETWQPVP